MKIQELKEKVKEFDKKVGFNKTDFSLLMDMFQEELNILKENKDNPEIVHHELTDLLILIMQVANRYDTDFEKEIRDWFEKSKKYLKK